MTKKQKQITKIDNKLSFSDIEKGTRNITELQTKVFKYIKDGKINKDYALECLDMHIDAMLEKGIETGKCSETSLPVFIFILKKQGISNKYNKMTHRPEIHGDMFSTTIVTGNEEEQKLYLIKECCRYFGFPTRNVLEYLKLTMEAYHPALDWVLSKKWDRKTRFEEFYESLGCTNDNQELAKDLLWKWLLQAMRSIMTDNGFVSENILVLSGKQGLGKTRWIKRLAPASCVKTGLHLNPTNKDSILEAGSVWIAELGELDGMTRKRDHADLKAYFSKDYDDIRRPYAVVEERIPRRTTFCASVNSASFLKDDTGNRRYWVLECGSKMNADHKIDLQQLWAEVYCEARYSYDIQPHFLNQDEIRQVNDMNEKFRQKDPVVESIMDNFNLLTGETYNATQIIKTCLDREAKAHECTAVKQHFINELGWVEKKLRARNYVLINPDFSGEAKYQEYFNDDKLPF